MRVSSFLDPLIASIESKLKEPALKRLVEEASKLDDLTRVVDDAVSEHSELGEPLTSIPDSLHIELPELWPAPTSTASSPSTVIPDSLRIELPMLRPTPTLTPSSPPTAIPKSLRVELLELSANAHFDSYDWDLRKIFEREEPP